MDIPILAGMISTVVFAVSNLPMLSKALRTQDVSRLVSPRHPKMEVSPGDAESVLAGHLDVMGVDARDSRHAGRATATRTSTVTS